MPYSSLPGKAFWKYCREAENFASEQIYIPKSPISNTTGIATAGSCFAQNIGRYLKQSSANYFDAEPAPSGMSAANMHRFGYDLYSGRYGNIYTAKQLMQLVDEVLHQAPKDDIVWKYNGKFYDSLRPTVEPDGLSSPEEVIAHRINHIQRLYNLFKKTDVFIFTLGLTETWMSRSSGLAFPTCPGVVAGRFDENEHYFHNARYSEIQDDLLTAFANLKILNRNMKFILTVSPVPLTATATGNHVLSATTYSKSTLRAVAGDLANDEGDIDYFPSYELITGSPYKGQFFETNLRQVTKAGVDFAMATFFTAHNQITFNDDLHQNVHTDDRVLDDEVSDENICEDLLLDAFLK